MLISTTSVLRTYLLFSCLQYNLCVARDTITAANPLVSENGDYISSAGNRFQLGFFTPRSGNYHYHGYVGIWYSVDAETIVWVANRHLPVSVDSTKNVTGVFTVEEDGNLKLLDSNQDSNYFSTNLNISGSSSRTAKLLDTGNLVLLDDQTGKMLWQSFDNPTDTFLPGMKMHKNLKLYSWLDTGNDPNYGKYWFEQDKDDYKGYLILKMDTRGNLEGDKKGDLIKIRKRVYWRSGGSANSFNPSKMFGYASQLLSNSAIDGDFSNSRLVMDSSGQIQFLSWDASTKLWVAKWSEPQWACSKYNFCGDFGSCTLNYETNSSSCKCLPGFEPTSPDYWKSREFYFSGCKRKSSIFCGKQSENDAFLNLKAIKVGNPNWPSLKVKSEQACRVNCLGNCQCQAYAYINASSSDASIRGCWIWTQGVSDIQEGNTSNIYNLFIRVANDSYNASIHANATGHGWPTIPAFKGSHQKNKMSVSRILVLISSVMTFGMLLVCSLIYISRKRPLTTGQVRMVDNTALVIASGMGAEGMMDQGLIRQDDGEGIDVPFFDLKSVLDATNNFSEANKLGQGGFGPVYKGKLFGREIAVKRLCVHSGQGLEEFKTEVVLIAKLQHRNLVRLLGYCIGGDEKILLYEYMPNKSLDVFLFDRTLCILLNWEKRFDIIMGVTRGLLYLHQDSRLRIIHRDMKASNILLDQDMKPKISDFGLARTVGGTETEASTNRVIGTFGYMSPEYALDGQFSIKSDVFSFGVVLLEIVSGRRNTGFYKSQLAWNLISYAWSLWKDEKALCLMDPRLEEECNGSEVVKCITIGLLCVQEDPRDRPTISKVLFMLGSEISTLPNPKEPAFVSRKLVSGPTSSASCEQSEN